MKADYAKRSNSTIINWIQQRMWHSYKNYKFTRQRDCSTRSDFFSEIPVGVSFCINSQCKTRKKKVIINL